MTTKYIFAYGGVSSRFSSPTMTPAKPPMEQ